MTTITYRDGVLAADSLISGDSTRWGQTRKIACNAGGWLSGVAGNNVGHAMMFMEWFEATVSPLTEPPPGAGPEMATGIVVSPRGQLFYWEGLRNLVPVSTPFTAIGSGAKVALGAMAAGADARQAVHIAKKYDVYTGGRIVTLRLASPPRSKTP